MSRVRLDLNGHHTHQDAATNGGSPTMLRRTLPKGRNPRVCVVGAGIAGMRCAQVLGEKGIDVTILEARDRTGGRMHQTTLGEHLIDHGPNWFHGIKGNPILDLARELGATTMSVPELAPSVYDQAGRLLSKGEGQQCSGLFWDIIEEAFQYSNKASASIPQEQSLLDFFEIKVKERELPQVTGKRVLDLCRNWGDYIGGTIERQSLKYFFLEETIDEALTMPSSSKPPRTPMPKPMSSYPPKSSPSTPNPLKPVAIHPAPPPQSPSPPPRATPPPTTK
ncbi:MAG: hypothetical protein Q9218_007138 [Villophora microphyllina]